MRMLLATVCTIALGMSVAWAQELTGAELKEKLIDHRVVWKSGDGSASGINTYKSDGTIVATVDGDKNTYKGTWRIKGNTLCEKFKKEDCATIRSLGGNKYARKRGILTVE